MSSRITFVVAHDAYLKGARNIARTVQERCHIRWLTTSPLLVDEQISLLDMDSSEGIELLADSDQIFVGLGGRDLNRLIRQLRTDTGSCAEIIGFFPGILHLQILESLATRLLCDRVLLNSPRDFELYRRLAEATLGYNNGVLLGAPWITTEEVISEPDIDWLFVEQSVVPQSLAERTQLAEKLYQLAATTPQQAFVVALRARKGQASSHQPEHCIEELCHSVCGSLPNLHFAVDDIDRLLVRTSVVATISSSVAFTSLARGQSTLFVDDFGIQRLYGNDLFVDSGCMQSIGYSGSLHPSEQWRNQYVLSMNVDAVAGLITDGSRLQEHKENAIPRVSYKNIALMKVITAYLISHGFWRWPEVGKMISSIKNINQHIYHS